MVYCVGAEASAGDAALASGRVRQKEDDNDDYDGTFVKGGKLSRALADTAALANERRRQTERLQTVSLDFTVPKHLALGNSGVRRQILNIERMRAGQVHGATGTAVREEGYDHDDVAMGGGRDAAGGRTGMRGTSEDISAAHIDVVTRFVVERARAEALAAAAERERKQQGQVRKQDRKHERRSRQEEGMRARQVADAIAATAKSTAAALQGLGHKARHPSGVQGEGRGNRGNGTMRLCENRTALEVAALGMDSKRGQQGRIRGKRGKGGRRR